MSTDGPIPLRVSTLSVTAVKGLALHHPEEIEVTADGIAGDRALFLVDEHDEIVSVTDYGDLVRHQAEYDPSTGALRLHGPNGLVHEDIVDGDERVDVDYYGLRRVSGRIAERWGDAFSAIVGLPVRLVLGDSGGFDVAGLTLLGDGSTRELAERTSSVPVDPRRFRMNIGFSGGGPHVEDSWDGALLAVGDVVMRVGGPVKRCAATTRHPESGVVDLQTLRMIGSYRGRQETPEFGKGFYFGVYAAPVTPGRIHVGDELALLG